MTLDDRVAELVKLDWKATPAPWSINDKMRLTGWSGKACADVRYANGYNDSRFLCAARNIARALIADWRVRGKRIKELEKLLAQTVQDSCDDDTKIRTACEHVLGREYVCGNSYGVPSLVEVVEAALKALMAE